MTPGVPSHGPGCSTLSYRTQCWICGDDVFHFRCTCGSTVLFGRLEPPWPIHHHDSLPYQRRMAIVEEKTGSRDSAARYLEKQMMTGTVDAASGRRVEPTWWRTVKPPPYPSPPDEPAREIVRMDPYSEAAEDVMGVVRDFFRDVDVYNRLGLPETSVSAAALGELGEGRFAQVTVHNTAIGEPDIESYTFFIRARQIARLDIRHGHLVRCSLRGVPVVNRDPV